MHLNMMIIDDFFDNPDEIRQMALTMHYPPATEKDYFPGRNSATRVTVPGLDNVISSLVRERLSPAPGTSHAVPRLAMAGDVAQRNVHIDQCHWSAIYYMTPDEHCEGGTNFYKHLPTNTEYAPYTADELKKVGFDKPSDIWDKVLNPHSNDDSKWQRTLHIPMKYNRLIIFRPWYYHSSGISFGETPETARLILPLFFVSEGALQGQG